MSSKEFSAQRKILTKIYHFNEFFFIYLFLFIYLISKQEYLLIDEDQTMIILLVTANFKVKKKPEIKRGKKSKYLFFN